MALLERTRADLQGVEDPREAALFVVRTEAIQYLAEKAKAGHELQNQAAELALRAKRRAGELLASLPKNLGGRGTGNSVLPVPTLDELGIGKIDSSRWQAVASVPGERFEQHLAEVQTKPNGELTTAGVLSLARHLTAQKARQGELE
jgi:hypothetical protein